MFKKTKFQSLAIIFMLFLCFSPIITYSAQSSNPNTGITYECGDGNTAGNCDFNDLVAATRKVVNWGVRMALFFSVIVIAYAGFKILTSGDNASQRTEARNMFQKVAIGIAFVLAAWLIVNLITTILLGRSLTTIFTS